MLNRVKPFKIMVLLTSLLLSTNGLAIEFPGRPNDADFFVDKAEIINT